MFTFSGYIQGKENPGDEIMKTLMNYELQNKF